MSDGRVRLFVALALPDPVRSALVRWRERLAPVPHAPLRPVSRDVLHVTLCFLGWQAEPEVESIAAACEVAGAEPPALLALGNAVWLPPRRPRVLAVELEDRDGRLARIQTALSGALVAGGWYEPEKRPYLAHVTVARVAPRASGAEHGDSGGRAGRAGSARGGGAGSRTLRPPPPLEFRGSDVVLYRSRLSRSGARYEALAHVPLRQ